MGCSMQAEDLSSSPRPLIHSSHRLHNRFFPSCMFTVISIEGGGIRQDEVDEMGQLGWDGWNEKSVGWRGLHRFLKCPQCTFIVISEASTWLSGHRRVYKYPLLHCLDNRITSNINSICIVRSGNITVVIPTPPSIPLCTINIYSH